MSGFLLDTHVISEFNRRGEPNRLVKQWLEAADTDSLYISVPTLGEMRFGVELLPPSKRRMQLEQWLDRDVPRYGPRLFNRQSPIATPGKHIRR